MSGLIVTAGGPAEATLKQKKMIHALGANLHLTHVMIGNLSETMFRRTISELSISEASDLIDHLLSLEAWSEYDDSPHWWSPLDQ